MALSRPSPHLLSAALPTSQLCFPPLSPCHPDGVFVSLLHSPLPPFLQHRGPLATCLASSAHAPTPFLFLELPSSFPLPTQSEQKVHQDVVPLLGSPPFAPCPPFPPRDHRTVPLRSEHAPAAHMSLLLWRSAGSFRCTDPSIVLGILYSSLL